MSETKHTPCPWERVEFDTGSVYVWAYEGEGDDEGKLVSVVNAEGRKS